MALLIECSREDLSKSLEALRLQPDNDASQRLRVESLLSAVHFQVMNSDMLEPSPLDLKSRSGFSYMGVCTSSTRARVYGHRESSFWYGMDDKSINFLAVMRPSKVLGREGIGSEMTAPSGECCLSLWYFCHYKLQKGWLHAEQRRLKKQYHIAYALATDGDVFRVFRMNKVGQSSETQCRSGNDYEDIILLLMDVFDDALVPPGVHMISPKIEFTAPTTEIAQILYEPDTDKDREEEERHKDNKRMDAMAVRAGATVYMDVLQELPVRLSDKAERSTLNLIRLVINKTIPSTFKAINEGNRENGLWNYGTVLVRYFDVQLKKVLEEVDFKDYNDNQKVLKDAIWNAILGEIRPVFEEMLKELRHKKLEKFFK